MPATQRSAGMPALSLRARLRRGDRLVGALVRMPCEETVEMLAVAGFDLIVIDCEHGPADVTALRSHIALAQLHGAAVVVRPGQHEEGLVLRALDQGAQGVLFPHVDSAADARAVVACAHYPPAGTRGFATYPRAGRFGLVPPLEHVRDAAERTLVLVMLESPVAARNADEILATDGVDGYLVGSADLAASTGDGDPAPEESAARIHRAGADAGTPRVTLVAGRDQADQAVADGARIVLHNVAQETMQMFTALAAAP